MSRFISYEQGSEGIYTEEGMQNLYSSSVDKKEYSDYVDWEIDMLKSGVFERA